MNQTSALPPVVTFIMPFRRPSGAWMWAEHDCKQCWPPLCWQQEQLQLRAMARMLREALN